MREVSRIELVGNDTRLALTDLRDADGGAQVRIGGKARG
jgi:hypothetical protein